jgi:phospholipase D1/2
MAGKPFKVGRFAHSLRIRLMREHLGVDVDAIYEEEMMSSNSNPEATINNVQGRDPDEEQHDTDTGATYARRNSRGNATKKTRLRDMFQRA